MKPGSPGFLHGRRVRDYRVGQIGKMPNVEVYFDSNAQPRRTFLNSAFAHVVLATGSRWRDDGVGRAHHAPVRGLKDLSCYTPDDWFEGTISAETLPAGRVAIFDDDQFYLGGVLAETLMKAGREVVLVTPGADVSAFTHNTLEQGRIQRRLLELGAGIMPHRSLAAGVPGGLKLRNVYADEQELLECGSVVMVTGRLPEDRVFLELSNRHQEWETAGIRSVHRIGDAFAPGTIAACVYSGHKYARELDAPATNDPVPFKRELPALEAI